MYMLNGAHRAPKRPNALAGWIVLAAFLLIGGCTQAQVQPTATVAPAVEIAAPGGEVVEPNGSGSPADEQGRELVLWTPEFLDPNPNSNAGGILATAYDRFEQDHPAARIEVQTKAEFGVGNLFDYVRKTQRAAPLALPQIILIDTQQLWRLVDLGMVPPMNPSEISGFPSLYPFTMESVQYQGQSYGIPFVADVIHAAFYAENTESFAPMDWTQFLAINQPYLFSTGGRNSQGGDALFLQYVGAGGELHADGALTNPEALEAVFNFWVAGAASGVIAKTVIDYGNLDAVWGGFSGGGTGFADVTATRYLAELTNLNTVGYASIPTRFGTPTTIGRVWAFVVLTNEPEERTLALELIRQLMVPQVQGNWSEAAHRLPTQEAALNEWKVKSLYLDFLRRMLDVAVALPNGMEFQELSTRLQAAGVAVLQSELTPSAAVQAVQNGR